MAYSATAISAANLAYMAADKPVLFANVMPTNPSVVKWNHEGTTAGTDHTDPVYPIYYTYDRQTYVDSRPLVAEANTTWYLYFDLGTTVSFDAVALINHNFGTNTLTTCQLQIANSADFATNPITIADFGTPSTDKRLIDLSLDPTVPNIYSGVQYIRLKLVNNTNHTPQLGELLLLKRQQLHYKPDRPYDNSSLHDEIKTSMSISGVHQSIISFQNQKVLEFDLMVDSSTWRDDLIAWHKQAMGSFVWLEDPTTTPTKWHYMIRDKNDINIELVEPGLWKFSLSGKENGPERFFYENE